jgi:hypothetical protein
MEEAGRDPAGLDVTTTAVIPDSLDKLRYYEESLGVTRVIFFLPSEGKDVVLPILDKYAQEFLAPLA